MCPAGASDDVNALVSGMLQDLASVQTVRQRAWGYKRAAAAVWRLERQLPELVARDGSLAKIPFVGPSTTRVILEVLDTGRSETVDRAIAETAKGAEIKERRSLRSGFLSRAEVVRILRDTTRPRLIVGDYQGDFQMHSRWSDGSATIDDLAAAGIARGYRYLAVTDHSKGLPVARGMSIEAMAAQHREIDAVNQRLGGRLHVLKGIEVNILADGSLDLTADELTGVDLVLVAPHSKLRTTDDQTPRLLKAVSTPGIHVLAHPRGRMAGSRAGIKADWDRVFAAAEQHGVAIEIDGDPARQDLDHTLAARALSAGCLFALDSDAHDTDELMYAETAIAHARLAGIPAERVINCWPLDRLLAWARDRAAVRN
jgi:histidinol phosphatase-like PHP family hydrolase